MLVAVNGCVRMLSLGVYKISDLQNFLSLLHQLDSDGVELPEAIATIQQRIDDFMRGKIGAIEETRKALGLSDIPLCPSCDIPMLASAFHPAFTCNKCFYSEVVS